MPLQPGFLEGQPKGENVMRFPRAGRFWWFKTVAVSKLEISYFPSNLKIDCKFHWIRLAEYLGFDIPKSLRVKLLPGRSLSALLCMDSAYLNPFF